MKTDGLSGDALKFAEQFNAAMANMDAVGKTDIDAAIKALNLPAEMIGKADLMAQVDSLKGLISDQGKIINEMKENPGRAGSKNMWDEIEKGLNAKKDHLIKMKGDPSAGSIEVKVDMHVYKDAATMMVSTSTGNSAYIPQPQFLPGIVDLVRNEPFLLDYLPVRNAQSARIVWTEKTNPQGTAQFIGEGEVKPLVSFEIKTNVSNAKKVADKIKVSNEMLDDIPYIMSEIRGELKYLVDMKTDEQLLSGDGEGDNLKGIKEYASLYVVTTMKTTNANNHDALRAGQAQLKSLNFSANYAFINPIDGANMDMQKAVDSGVYLLPPFTTADGRRLGSMLVVETNQIPVGDVLIMDSRKAKVYRWIEFVIKIGYVNDDFEKNLVTIIGEQRLHFFIPENWVNGFLYDSFANIKTALTDVVNP